MLFHEFEKSLAAAAEQREQFSNFIDRGFALAVKNKTKNRKRKQKTFCDEIF